ncbi:MAG: hypothetical protein JSW11_01090 [Candidatus Heimdallarchaeota archaeon]|nr:MAG: hypothetical protein JSW11_01090 [Candidatus Heimdallarchaeota archaeon]
MAQNNEVEIEEKNTEEKEGDVSAEGIFRYFQWMNEDWLSLFVGLIIVLLALLGLLDWITW